MTLQTTLNEIKSHDPCESVWKTLLKSLNKTKVDDTKVSLRHIIESNGLSDALWCLRLWPEHDKEWRLLAVSYAREVQHLMKDPRSIRALDVAEAYAKGEATKEELIKAKKEAFAAYVYAAYVASYAASDASDAASDASDAASDAVYAASDASDASANVASMKSKQKVLLLKAIDKIENM